MNRKIQVSAYMQEDEPWRLERLHQVIGYIAAMESMAAQFVHPKTTALQLAKEQLRMK